MRFTARLPRYVVAALECLAEENGESADALLTRELLGLAYAHRERLGASIAGFAEAVNCRFRKRRRRDSVLLGFFDSAQGRCRRDAALRPYRERGS